MLLHFSAEYTLILRLVAIMLLVPIDTSECERVFSLMNDIKSDTRNKMGIRNLRNLMFWHYHAKAIPFNKLHIRNIIEEFLSMGTEAVLNKSGRRGPHRGTAPMGLGDEKLKVMLLASASAPQE
eukprot:scaffold139676_cov39-Tisochrysis_lutea.AAC.1